MKRFFSILAVIAVMAMVSSCSVMKGVSNIQKNGTTVAYTELRNYFVNNTHKTTKTERLLITSQAQFDEIFGAAAVMGANGRPTNVNFKKQFVMAVLHPETNKAVQMYPVSVLEYNGAVLFNYKVVTGATQSYTSAPYTAVVLDRPVNDSQFEVYWNEK